MRCSEFEERLLDEDCRRAFKRGAAGPADMEAHMAVCVRCRDTWRMSKREVSEITRFLTFQPPSLLRRELYAIMPRPSTDSQAWIHWSDVTWGVAGGSVGAALCLFLPSCSPVGQWIGACLGLSHALVIAVVWRLCGGLRLPRPCFGDCLWGRS